ncbi:hypothetical protein DL93DRAFT_2079894 [Clavulina sp. PMI_390]|nr:hypothetical protein DL93DRAFT_2079894 [Clavulina sp. PMI_390]
MKVSLSALLLLPVAASAAYTEGWKPGQAYTRYQTSSATGTAATSIPTKDHSAPRPPSLNDITKLFDLEYLLTEGPLSRVAQRLGWNVTEHLEKAREGVPPRFNIDIPLLTDENYEQDLLNEQFSSAEEEEDRVWAIMCSVGTQDPVSSYFDQLFDSAHNLTVKAGDLTHVRWARIDYLQVTELTSRWSIWKAPVLVIAKDQGRELRFFKVSSLRLFRNPQDLRDFLINEEYIETAPWSGPWSPTGSRCVLPSIFSQFFSSHFAPLCERNAWLIISCFTRCLSARYRVRHMFHAKRMMNARHARPLNSFNRLITTRTIIIIWANPGSAVKTTLLSFLDTNEQSGVDGEIRKVLGPNVQHSKRDAALALAAHHGYGRVDCDQLYACW